MRKLLNLFVCFLYFVSTGCVWKAEIFSKAHASSPLQNIVSSETFTAEFKADNTSLKGIYNESTTSAVIQGTCTPGDLIIFQGSIFDIVQTGSTFCDDSRTWSVPVNMTALGTASTFTHQQLLPTVSTRGSSASSATIHISFSPNSFPSVNSYAEVYTSGGTTYITPYIYPNGAFNYGDVFSGEITHIGLLLSKQYKYRIDIYRSNALLVNFGEVSSLTQTLQSSSYTYQNGDIIKVTAFDSNGDGPTINLDKL